MRRNTIAVVLATLCLLSGSTLAADRVELSDGRILVGNLTKMDSRVAVIETTSGTIRVSADSVRSVQVVEGEAEKAARAESARVARAARESTDSTAGKPATKATTKAADKRRSSTPDAEQLALFSTCRKLLASKKAAHRGDALDLILSNWPATAMFLDSALKDSSERVRLDATRLLAEPKILDAVKRLRPRLRDTSATVRMLAARVVRQRKLVQLELELARLLRKDPSPAVRQEALRSLEEVGTVAAAAAVLDTWEATEDDRTKRRARKTLARMLGADHGDNGAAWQAAVRAAELAVATAGPVKAGGPDQAPPAGWSGSR